MFSIKCDNCGEEIFIDGSETFDSYMKNYNYLMDDKGKIVEGSINQYLIYKCPLCNKRYKFTYKDWEKRFREKIAQDVMEARKMEMFSKQINPQTIDPDHGVEFCGQCSGYDGTGYCFVDVIKQCTIRKDK